METANIQYGTNKINKTTNLNLIKILTVFGIFGIILVSGCVEEDKELNNKIKKLLSQYNISVIEEPGKSKIKIPENPGNVTGSWGAYWYHVTSACKKGGYNLEKFGGEEVSLWKYDLERNVTVYVLIADNEIICAYKDFELWKPGIVPIYAHTPHSKTNKPEEKTSLPIFFPTQKEPATSSMDADLEDELIVDENGCIRAKGGEGYLFSLDLKYKQYLKTGEIDEQLRKALERIYIDSSARISKINEKRWKINDRGHPYIIEETGKNLNIYDNGKYLLIWPHGFSLITNKDGVIQIIDDTGKPIARVGDKISIGGGETSKKYYSDIDYISGISAQLPDDRCPGPYWIVGEIEKPIITNENEVVPNATNFSVISANNQFALDLYSEFKEDEGNIFFSPYSISTALAMTYEGARGQTAEEMQSVLHFPEDDATRRTEFSKIINQINKENKDYELRTANALWAQKDYKFLDTYFSIIEQYYGGKVTNLDFVSDTENSRITINNWVENQTNNKIKDLIPPGVLNEMTRLVLTNAIYFKGTWVNPFDKEKTTDADFRVSPDKTVKVQMMTLKRQEKIIKFNYTETEEVQIIEIPYEGNDLSMLIILPKNDNLNLIEESFSVEKLEKWKSNLKEGWVNVYIPKFKFETKYFMNENLKEMGMPTAFSGDADFSGMDGTKNLFISNVIHQAFVEVNEEGTEAAAATAVALATGLPPTFRADHPFIFIIQDKKTRNILFMGRVIDPTQK